MIANQTAVQRRTIMAKAKSEASSDFDEATNCIRHIRSTEMN